MLYYVDVASICVKIKKATSSSSCTKKTISPVAPLGLIRLRRLYLNTCHWGDQYILVFADHFPRCLQVHTTTNKFCDLWRMVTTTLLCSNVGPLERPCSTRRKYIKIICVDDCRNSKN